MTGAIDAIAELLRAEIGLDAGILGARGLALAVATRMKALDLSEVADYRVRLAAPAEIQQLVDEVTVPETWFFRDPAAFELLAAHALAQRDRQGGTYRVLSAPCASGEEAYSIAISLLDAGIVDFEVLAIDVAAGAITKARSAVYSPRAERGAAVPQRHRRPLGDGAFGLSTQVTERVRCQLANVADPGFLGDQAPFDAIFCRNLLIYLTADARRQCLAAMARLLTPDALLFTGIAESAPAIDPRFVASGLAEAFAWRRLSEAPIALARPPADVAPRWNAHPSVAAPRWRSDSATYGRIQPPPPERPLQAAASAGTAAIATAGLSRAQVLADSGQDDAALAICNALVAAGSTDRALFLLRGLIHKALGRLDDAQADLLRALAIDPALAAAHWHLSGLAERRGNAVRAAGHRRRAAELRAKAEA
jgi:chemotaxis protein methyltransferase WspC